MLRSLRIKFVIVIMCLVGAVLVSVLGGSFYSFWQTQRDMTEDALQRGLNGDLRQGPMIGDERSGGQQGKANMLVITVDVSQDGMLLETNNAPVIIDSDILGDVLQEALSSNADRGNNEELHITWLRAQREDGSWRIVIADTSAAYYALRSLFVKDIVIIVLAMGVLLGISIGLSTWMLKPVEEAWNQQRRFVADASHELKTPLAVIIANTQILAKDPTISEEGQRWVKSTADESTHMKNLVEELLELARTDESQVNAQGIMQSVDIDFSELVENSTLELDAIAFEHNCELQSEIEENIHVSGDPEWLGRLGKILIENAIKYSSAGSVVMVRLHKEGRKGYLAVNNHGQVIEPEDLAHVFDRFYRTDKARSRNAKTGGFGLGLAIAKGIVTSHGGTISAASNATDGTTFTVMLPCT